ncbi:sortase-associated OmpA-like protein PdsO [uncultured Photobacterium sp.]|uniref:sortase-associated OmpA-like protein PdsO n=1 Tax=uncultured Photobacterium sp. TaxID=173973 RepID=UPI00260388CD|nr:sortase-associated OmpA-like protein PdsO [uncultured Photobacterium sp.]
MKKQLISTLIATTLMTSVIASAAQANTVVETDDAYKLGQQEQLIGMGSGAAFGALVAGPAGVVIGGIIGGIIGTTVGQEDHIKAQDEEVLELTLRNTELERISQHYNQAQLEIARLQQDAIQQDRFLQEKIEQHQIDLALEMNVHFRTGSATIEPHFQTQLDELADLMKQAPEVSWELAGYADRRGNSQKNMSLSQRRVEAVREYLELQGVDANQIVAAAYGDQEPLKSEQNFEGDFFDRRVTLRSNNESVQTAHSY